MRIALGVFAACSIATSQRAFADPKPDCSDRRPIALGTRIAADLKTTYELDDKRLRICVVKAAYPYAAGRGHRLSSCLVAMVGDDEQRFCGDGDMYADFRGYRIHVALRKPRFTESSDVWLWIDRPPPPRAT